NLLDSLQITAHNKFSEFIAESLPQYKSIICDDPSEALTNSKIFITDYSSIIYDAIFRGAYPIFYWKDKDYLIENYQAIPPVNDQNAPGKIAYSEEEIIKHVKSAIDKDFLIEDENLKKYRMINEFYDRQNSNRVINILKENNILKGEGKMKGKIIDNHSYNLTIIIQSTGMIKIEMCDNILEVEAESK